MFDCVLADRSSVGDHNRTQDCQKKVNCWWRVDYYGCQDEKDEKIEKIWRERKHIRSKLFKKKKNPEFYPIRSSQTFVKIIICDTTIKYIIIIHIYVWNDRKCYYLYWEPDKKNMFYYSSSSSWVRNFFLTCSRLQYLIYNA